MKEEIKLLVQRQLDELQQHATEVVKAIELKQEEHRHLIKQIKGLKLFLEPLAEVAASTDYEETAHMTPPARVVKDTIADILTSVYPENLHYIEIYHILNSKGYDLPGKDPKQNLLSYLSRDDRFVRCEERGCYTINEKYLLTSVRGLSRSIG